MQPQCGEVIATMSWECIRYELDIIAGDGNRVAYYATSKSPGVPTYECSLLQFWIDRMINTATQARIMQFGPSPKVRSKHFITCSYNDLAHLSHNLRGITTENYTDELAKKVEGYGECCTFSVLEWGHSRNDFSENVDDYDDDDHMDFEGEFSFQVTETCLHGSSKSFLISQDDRDSHNPMLVHLTSQEMTWNEARTYIPWEKRYQQTQHRKAKQKANKRKSFPLQEEQGARYWDDPRYASGSSSSAAPAPWRPRYR